MKRLLIAALMGIGFMAPAQAQTVHAGVYDVEGTNLDGSAYGGTAKITLTSKTTCAIEWTTGSATKATSTGICMLYGDSFAAGYIMGGKSVGLVVYKVNGDGSLDGAWTITGEDGSGTETLTPQ